jgi:hypothetical protein
MAWVSEQDISSVHCMSIGMINLSCKLSVPTIDDEDKRMKTRACEDDVISRL